MICPNCGKELVENAKFCVKCGCKVDVDETLIMETDYTENCGEEIEGEQNAVETPTLYPNMEDSIPVQGFGMQTGAVPAQLKGKKKGKRKIFIVILIIILLLIGCGCGYIFYRFNLPINKIDRAFSHNDIDAALEYVDQIDNEKDRERMQQMAYDYAEEMRDNYINEVEGIDYALASTTLTRLYSEVLSNNVNVGEMIENIKTINDSRTAFASAEKFRTAGKYIDAIEEYRKVVEEDIAYYQLAQQLLEDTIVLYRDDTMDTVKVYEENGDYIQAKQLIEDALAVLPTDSELLSELNVINSFIKDQELDNITEKINNAINEENYEEAFRYVTDALEAFPNNAEILNVQTVLKEKYKEKMYAELEELYNSNSINEAIALLNQMQTYLPGDSEIADLLILYQSYLPTSFSELEIYEDNSIYRCYYDKYQMLVDTYDNIYYGAIRLATSYGWGKSMPYGELVFLVNNNYNRISGTLAYENCENTNGSIHLEIYADNTLVYTSPAIDDSSRPFQFEAYLGEDCHKMTVMWVSNYEDVDANVILADAQVYKR